jgi:hypothetical protein
MKSPWLFIDIKKDECGNNYFAWPGAPKSRIYGGVVSGGVVSGTAWVRGGVVSGGVVRGGEVSGTTWVSGGVVSGGEVSGGVVSGGVVSGGEVSGTAWVSGGIHDGKSITFVVSHLQYDITINLSCNSAQIGCYHKTLADWLSVTLDDALKMGLKKENYEPIREFLKKFV